MNSNVTYGFWVIMVCLCTSRFLDCNNVLVQDVDRGGGWLVGAYGNYFLLNFAVKTEVNKNVNNNNNNKPKKGPGQVTQSIV